MSAAAYVSSTNGNNAGAGSFTKPSGVASGDHLIITVLTDTTSSSPTITGYQRIAYRSKSVSGIAGVWAVFYRVADGTEGSTVTPSSVGTSSTSWTWVVYRGGSRPSVVAGSSGTALGSTSVARSRLPVAGTVLHLLGGMIGGNTPTLTTPTGTTLRESGSGSFYIATAVEEAGSAGDDNTRTGTIAITGGGSTSSALGVSTTLLFATGAQTPYVVATANNAGNSTNATVTIPSSAAAGDLVILAYEVTANTLTSGPSGFTSLASGQQTGGTNSDNYWIGYKVIVSGDVGAAKAVVSSSQVWAAACIVIRSPQATAVQVTGTKKGGSGNPATFTSATATAPAFAVYVVTQAVNSNTTDPGVDQATAPGVDWQTLLALNNSSGSNFGFIGFSLGGLPNGVASLLPDISAVSTSSWETLTFLINAPADFTGAASKTVTISGTAAGLLGLVGSASKTITISATAAGALGRFGSASKTITISATAAGALGLSGAATSTLSVAGTAAGTVLVAGDGAAIGTLSVGATAAGVVGRFGSATKTITISATAAGALGFTGAASKTITISATAAGRLGVVGTATKTVTISATAAGRLGVVGAASKTLTITAVAAGAINLGGPVTVTGTTQVCTFPAHTGYPAVPADLVVVCMDKELRRAPTSLAVSVYGADADQSLTFKIDGVTVDTETADGNGTLNQISIPVTAAVGTQGSHTLSVVSSTATGSDTFTIDMPPVNQPFLQNADTDPVAIPEAIKGVYYQWVFQDLMAGGLGSWVMPINPSSMTSPGVSHDVEVQHSTAVEAGQFHIWEHGNSPVQWSFSGYCPDEAFYLQLRAYAALTRRLYIIDHRNRAWKVAIVGVDIVPRLRTLDETGTAQDWRQDYTVHAYIYEQSAAVPV